VEWKLPLVAAVIFLATLIRSAFGFGEALVAVPARGEPRAYKPKPGKPG